jgi:hypothetical protein
MGETARESALRQIAEHESQIARQRAVVARLGATGWAPPRPVACTEAWNMNSRGGHPCSFL